MAQRSEISFQDGSWITHGLALGGAVRVVLAEAAEIADALRQAHGLKEGATQIATEAALAALLLSAHAKGRERLTLQLALVVPEARFIGEIDADHRFRGRFSPSRLGSEIDPIDLHGLLLAVKHDEDREVYRGVTAVEGTSIAGALRVYLRDSAQLHGIILVDVVVDDEGRVTRAVAALIERLAPQEGYESLSSEAFAANFAHVEGQDVDRLRELVAGNLAGEPIRVLDRRPVFWGCSCSRTRVLDTLAGLGPEELRAMADEDDGASVDCHFCNAHYEITADELRSMAE
ncbi:MAG: Hsp33 family molecular chaperone HslO [Deltaproteobacteria bacterium]|nr:MAG: Hsp33 family molecular chaperone HslO [Deltaproteobacteria bacterium]